MHRHLPSGGGWPSGSGRAPGRGVDVGGWHVDLRAEGPRAVGELAGAHPPEEVEALVDGAGRDTRYRPRSVSVPRVFRTSSAVRSQTNASRPDERLAELVEPLEVVRREVETVPGEAEPADVLLDRVDVLDVLLERIVSSKRRLQVQPVILRDRPKFRQIDLACPMVEVAVRFGREPGRTPRRRAFRCGVLVQDLADEVLCRGPRGGAATSRVSLQGSSSGPGRALDLRGKAGFAARTSPVRHVDQSKSGAMPRSRSGEPHRLGERGRGDASVAARRRAPPPGVACAKTASRRGRAG